jgi:sugar transferase (PEP-CTERM/EpsH1 system associated)
MDILFLSHCVPNPPDKGEKIRALHELNALTGKHRVHLVCFARSAEEVEKAREMRDRCASVFVERLAKYGALAGAMLRFAVGGCLNTSFYRSPAVHQHVDALKRLPLRATLAYSSAVVQFAPPDVPLWIDMVDVDSEKWMEYGQSRWPGAFYTLEGRRFRALEADYTKRARCTFLTTPREQSLLRKIAPQARIETWINGVDFGFFDPELRLSSPDLENREYVVFVGQMDYFPNVDACCSFVKSVLAELRSQRPSLEFLIVGRNPARAVRQLASQPGVTVTGGVADVRPYLANARALVAPLRIARGVQNKVLEALAMGKRVLASPAVASSFGTTLPEGVAVCESGADYIRNLGFSGEGPVAWEAHIRKQAKELFSWDRNLLPVVRALERADAVASA